MLNEKIRELRKQNNLTQEELAEKLNVSRQAITKWETGAGIPDIGNIEAIARLFGISIDALLSDNVPEEHDNVSRSEFDIFERGDFDLDIGCAARFSITAGDTEKAVIEIRTDLADKAYRLAKVKLENGKRIDIAVIQIQLDKKYVSVETNKTLSRQDARDHIFINAVLPKDLTGNVEISGDIGTLEIRDIPASVHMEFDGKATQARIMNSEGHIELTSKTDMDIYTDGACSQLDINQTNAVSTLHISKDAKANIYNDGRSCSLVFDGFESDTDAENRIELNGRKTELTVKGE